MECGVLGVSIGGYREYIDPWGRWSGRVGGGLLVAARAVVSDTRQHAEREAGVLELKGWRSSYMERCETGHFERAR